MVRCIREIGEVLETRVWHPQTFEGNLTLDCEPKTLELEAAAMPIALWHFWCHRSYVEGEAWSRSS